VENGGISHTCTYSNHGYLGMRNNTQTGESPSFLIGLESSLLPPPVLGGRRFRDLLEDPREKKGIVESQRIADPLDFHHSVVKILAGPLDFQANQLPLPTSPRKVLDHFQEARCRPLRMLNVVDELSRECLRIHVDRKVKAADEIFELSELFIERGVPEYLWSDNGPELVAEFIREWLRRVGTQTLFIEPGSPWENGYIESFNGKSEMSCSIVRSSTLSQKPE
jgi:transposase InsO family protein